MRPILRRRRDGFEKRAFFGHFSDAFFERSKGSHFVGVAQNYDWGDSNHGSFARETRDLTIRLRRRVAYIFLE